MNNEDTCVCCGAVVPEGTHVCPNCLVCQGPITKSKQVKDVELEDA